MILILILISILIFILREPLPATTTSLSHLLVFSGGGVTSQPPALLGGVWDRGGVVM